MPDKDPLTVECVLKHVDEVDQRHDDAHQRLRRDFRDVERRVDNLEHSQAENAVQFAQLIKDLEAIDVGRLRFSPALVVSLIVIILSGGGSAYVFSMGLRADLRDNRTEMTGHINLQNQRYAEIKDALARAEASRLSDKLEAQRKLEELQRNAREKTLIAQGAKK